MATYYEQTDANDKTQISCLPKNIRQLGTIQGSTRIYMEDFVYTYLHGNTILDNWEHRGCILLGNSFTEKGQKISIGGQKHRGTDTTGKDGCPV